ncbi:MAG: cache and HAMP domain-containing protein, partial [Sneathiellales bacterium]|nr:cache and HAMP domain-containing protein [Sneathiellales bacterium]
MAILNLRISQKLPLLILSASLLLGLSLGFLSYFQGSTAVNEEVVKKLQVVLQGRQTALSNYLQSIKEDLHITATNPEVITAIKGFSRAWEELGDNQLGKLQKSYITDNQFPTGEKEKLDYAKDGTAYSDLHKSYHPWFREMLYTREYYDIFLFDLEGNLVYSVFKELDYATNLNTGEWKDSGLGEVFRGALANKSGDGQAFIDFKPYAPSADAPASFIGSVVYDAEKPVGVLVFQMSISRLNSLMQNSTGLGESGESYIVGGDFLMRSDSRFSEETTILKRKVETEAAKKAINGESGALLGEDYRGIVVKSVYGPINFMGTTWGLLAEMDESEYAEPVSNMRNMLALIGVILLIVIGAIGTFFARNIAASLVTVTDAMKSLANGNLEVKIPENNRNDEVGDMFGALAVFRDGAVEQKRLEKEAADAAVQASERDKQDREREAEQMRQEREREQTEIAEREARSEKVAGIGQSFE